MTDQEERFPKERRRAPRVGGAMVEYTIEGGDPSKKMAFIKDICIYGVCIYVPEFVAEGTILSTDIFLFGKEEPLCVKGRVVWQKIGDYLSYHNIGIEFTDISEKERKKLFDHIDANYQVEKNPEDDSA